MVKLSAAIDENGNLIHIDDVTKCGSRKFYCPDQSCNAELIARKGAIKAHHFAHKAGSNDCYGLETYLHLYAKEILSESKELSLPPAYMSFREAYKLMWRYLDKAEKEVGFSLPRQLYMKQVFWEHRHIKPLRLIEATTIDLTAYDVKVEQYLGKIKPDIILTHKESKRSLHIEVTVTHRIDQNKKEVIKANDYAFLEIDFSGQYDKHRLYSKADVERLLEKGSYNWFHIPNRKRLIYKRRNELMSFITKTLMRLKSFYLGELEPYLQSSMEDIRQTANAYDMILDYSDESQFSSSASLYKYELHQYFLERFKQSEFYKQHIQRKQEKEKELEEWREQFYGKEFYEEKIKPWKYDK